ncbi:MAG: nitroreductase family protein [Victivallaceae bacterium]|nr:nitroreductase family protein [Victivallaceae bacterium]
MSKEIDFIKKRRSVRKFRKLPVTDEQVTRLLEAAMAAPSAVAKDPWRFIVVRRPEHLRTIAGFLPNGGFLPDADVGIIVCGDLDAAHSNSLSYLLQDCSAAIENLLLAASALDLGACWLGVHPREDRIENISKFCKLPENIIPVAVIAIGVPAIAPDPRTRYNPAYVRSEKWQ